MTEQELAVWDAWHALDDKEDAASRIASDLDIHVGEVALTLFACGGVRKRLEHNGGVL